MTPAEYIEKNYPDADAAEKLRLISAAAGFAASQLRELRQRVSHKTAEQGSE